MKGRDWLIWSAGVVKNICLAKTIQEGTSGNAAFDNGWFMGALSATVVIQCGELVANRFWSSSPSTDFGGGAYSRYTIGMLMTMLSAVPAATAGVFAGADCGDEVKCFIDNLKAGVAAGCWATIELGYAAAVKLATPPRIEQQGYLRLTQA